MFWDDLRMQGSERVGRQLLDAQALVGHLVPAGSVFAFLAAHRGELFSDGDFADLFPSGRGRPSVPASVMASVMVLQVLHDYSDAEAAEAARCDLRWKAACGFPLDHGGFELPAGKWVGAGFENRLPAKRGEFRRSPPRRP
jgi:Transposase domain (DUF772)